jgi:3,4-dihydroxy 2-butanone 4-phosphate synthase/GTP cyclohydrolase II
VRVQSLELLRDVIGTTLAGEPGWNLRRAMARIAAEGHGAVVMIGLNLPREATLATIDAYPERPPTVTGGGNGLASYRIIGTGAEILRQLGIGRMRLMSSPLKFSALSGFDLEVVDFLAP